MTKMNKIDINDKNFKDIPFGTVEKFNVVVEVPKGSNEKYELDEKDFQIKWDFTYKDLVFPFDYGYISQIHGGDGDMLDAILIAPRGFNRGDVVECRTVGYVEMLDRGVEDNKFIVVPIAEDGPNDITEIPESDLDKWEAFWAEAARQKEKKIVIKGFKNKKEATELLQKSIIH